MVRSAILLDLNFNPKSLTNLNAPYPALSVFRLRCCAAFGRVGCIINIFKMFTPFSGQDEIFGGHQETGRRQKRNALRGQGETRLYSFLYCTQLHSTTLYCNMLYLCTLNTVGHLARRPKA